MEHDMDPDQRPDVDRQVLHTLEFFLYMPTGEGAEALQTLLVAQGFTVAVDAPQEDRTDWLVFATREMIPEHSALLAIRQTLTALAAEHGGEYDGWGTEIVEGDSE
jgi:regulator of RNase E activity RraB